MPNRVFKYEITKNARKDLDKLNPKIRKRIGKKLQFFLIKNNPLQFSEKLIDAQDGDYRFRVGDYRVVFSVEKNIIYLLRVQHRKEAYQKKP